MIIEKQKLRLRKKRLKKLYKNIIAFFIVSICSIALLMLGALLDRI